LQTSQCSGSRRLRPRPAPTETAAQRAEGYDAAAPPSSTLIEGREIELLVRGSRMVGNKQGDRNRGAGFGGRGVRVSGLLCPLLLLNCHCRFAVTMHSFHFYISIAALPGGNVAARRDIKKERLTTATSAQQPKTVLSKALQDHPAYRSVLHTFITWDKVRQFQFISSSSLSNNNMSMLDC